MNNKQSSSGENRFSKGIFSAIPAEDWISSSGFQPPVPIERKSALYWEGDPASHVYLVESGLIKTFKRPANDRVQIIRIASAGDVLSADGISRDSYQESAASLTRASVYKIPRDQFMGFLMNRPKLAVKLAQMMNEEFARFQSLIVNLGTKKALPRVSSCLLLFMEKQTDWDPGQGHNPEPFTLPISRQDMGAFLGLSPETVSRQLKELVKRRVIRLDHKRLTVLNYRQLCAIAES